MTKLVQRENSLKPRVGRSQIKEESDYGGHSRISFGRSRKKNKVGGSRAKNESTYYMRSNTEANNKYIAFSKLNITSDKKVDNSSINDFEKVKEFEERFSKTPNLDLETYLNEPKESRQKVPRSEHGHPLDSEKISDFGYESTNRSKESREESGNGSLNDFINLDRHESKNTQEFDSMHARSINIESTNSNKISKKEPQVSAIKKMESLRVDKLNSDSSGLSAKSNSGKKLTKFSKNDSSKSPRKPSKFIVLEEKNDEKKKVRENRSKNKSKKDVGKKILNLQGEIKKALLKEEKSNDGEDEESKEDSFKKATKALLMTRQPKKETSSRSRSKAVEKGKNSSQEKKVNKIKGPFKKSPRKKQFKKLKIIYDDMLKNFESGFKLVRELERTSKQKVEMGEVHEEYKKMMESVRNIVKSG